VRVATRRVNRWGTTGLPATRPGYDPFVQVDEVQPGQSPASITELYDRFCGPACSLARRIVGDAVLAEDVVQEVFLQIWRTPGAFDPVRGSFSAWLMTMVHHKAVDAVRREQSQRDRRDRVQSELATEPPPAVDVEDQVCDRAVAQRVRLALGALPAAQRQALALAYYDGFTQCEIADMTGTPLGTVKSRMRAGMHQLRKVLHEVSVPLPVPTAAATS
jgi:RNA polymerase sigma factor (sigma-70 family)